MEIRASEEPSGFRVTHGKFKKRMDELNGKENPAQKFDEDVVDFFKHGVRRKGLIRKFVKEYGPFFKKEIRQIDRNISQKDLDWIVRLHIFGTVAKNVKEGNIDFSAKKMKKAMPKLFLLAEGFGVQQAASVPIESQRKLYNFIVGHVRDEKNKEWSGEESHSDPYALKHVAFKSNLISYLLFEEGKLGGLKGKFRDELMETIQKTELPFFRDEVIKKEINPAISEKNEQKLLRFYTIASLLGLLGKGQIDAPPERLERLVYDILEGR